MVVCSVVVVVVVVGWQSGKCCTPHILHLGIPHMLHPNPPWGSCSSELQHRESYSAFGLHALQSGISTVVVVVAAVVVDSVVPVLTDVADEGVVDDSVVVVSPCKC